VQPFPQDFTRTRISKWIDSLPPFELYGKMCKVFEASVGSTADSPLDGWGTPLEISCVHAEGARSMPYYVVVSAGPDREFGTSDDLRVQGVSSSGDGWRDTPRGARERRDAPTPP
jgi:hypothetical protein